VSAEVIGGYRLQNLMMTGQTSQVWEVVELSSSRHFAMKFLLPEKARDPEYRSLLAHEANVGIKMRHPNVIKIIHLQRDKQNPWFVMEFFPAGSVKLRLLRKQQDFIRERSMDILKQTATALAYMNSSGWVHRDVKPDNILMNSAGELRLIDFALAKRVQRKSLFGRMFRSRGKAQGTPSYMSPEQIRNEPTDGRADIYSFGCSAYEITTGRPPFRGMSMQDLLQRHIVEKPTPPKLYNPDVTDEFTDLVLRCLAKKREDRPKDFHEILIALRGIRVFKTEPAKKEAD
jgi:serine/threonine protein kinase